METSPPITESELEHAVRTGNWKLAADLIDAGADLSPNPIEGNLLTIACEGPKATQEQTIRFLLAKLTFPPEEIEEAAFHAGEMGVDRRIRNLLREAGADGHLFLLGKISGSQDDKRAAKLARKVRVNHPWAPQCLRNTIGFSEPAALVLLHKGIRSDDDEWDDIGTAASAGHNQVVKILAGFPAEGNQFAENQMLLAAINDDPELTAFNLFVCTDQKASATWCLGAIARQATVPVVSIFAQALHDAELLQELALIPAACAGNTKLVEAIIQSGVRDRTTGLAATAGALKHNHPEIFEMLVDHLKPTKKEMGRIQKT